MKFIEITDEEALNFSADQLIAIAVYNQLCLNATLEQDDPEISLEHIDEQYQKLMQQIKG